MPRAAGISNEAYSNINYRLNGDIALYDPFRRTEGMYSS